MNPGSKEARAKSCTCPEEQNQGGQGTFSVVQSNPSETHFVINQKCPMHGETTWRQDS